MREKNSTNKPLCEICGKPTCYNQPHKNPEVGTCCKRCHGRYCTVCKVRNRARLVRHGRFKPAHVVRAEWKK